MSLTLESNTIWSLYTGAPDGHTQSYSLLNLRAGYTFRTKVDVKPFLKLDNILNKHYEIMYGCPMPGMTVMEAPKSSSDAFQMVEYCRMPVITR